MRTENKKDQIVMWILLIIILNSPPTHIVNSKVLGIYQGKQECEKYLDIAFLSDPPANSNLGCLKLEGVKQTNG